MDHQNHETKYGRFFASHIIAALLFALLGGAVSWGFSGRAGNIMQGISAMLLLGVLAGKYLPDLPPHRSTPSVPHGQRAGTGTGS